MPNLLELARKRYPLVTDGPDLYGRACAYIAASLVLADKVYLPYATRSLKPGLWTCLVGPTTVVRKSTSLEYAAGIGSLVGLDFLDDLTPEGLTEQLSKGRVDLLTREIKKPLDMGTKEYNKGLIASLTDYYDSGSIKVSRKQKGALSSLKEPIITWSAATTEEYLDALAGRPELVSSGFFARFILVYCPKRDKPQCSWGIFDPGWFKLAVRRLGGIRGAMGLGVEAFKRLEERSKETEALSSGLFILRDMTKRMPEHIIKIAMTEAACGLESMIEPAHIDRAADFIVECGSRLRALEAALAGTPFSRRAHQLHRVIRHGGRMAYSEILNQFPPKNSREIPDLLKHLEDAGRIKKDGTKNLESCYADASKTDGNGIKETKGSS